MRATLKELLGTFVQACKETPAGMLAPFRSFADTALNNPVLNEKHSNK